MPYRGPALLESSHQIVEFRSDVVALDIWLRTRALANQSLGTSRTWVVTDTETDEVVGYYASSTASVLRAIVPNALRRNQPEEMPAVLLGRMAVDHRHQGRGLGSSMLKHLFLKVQEISAVVGVRLILVHAKSEDARAFYEHFGFESSPQDRLTLVRRNHFVD